MSKANTTEKYLIVLSGQGDIDIRLANAAAKYWIEKDPKNADGWTETIPAAVCKGHETEPENRKVGISIGSYENDRALNCPGMAFDSITAALQHCKANGLEIVGDYVGYIY